MSTPSQSAGSSGRTSWPMNSATADADAPQPRRDGRGATDTGPRNVILDRQNPDLLAPPPTDHREHRRRDVALPGAVQERPFRRHVAQSVDGADAARSGAGAPAPGPSRDGRAA